MPQTGIAPLVVIDLPVTDTQRTDLLAALLQISGRHPATPGGPRCIEGMMFIASELAGEDVPALAEFNVPRFPASLRGPVLRPEALFWNNHPLGGVVRQIQGTAGIGRLG